MGMPTSCWALLLASLHYALLSFSFIELAVFSVRLSSSQSLQPAHDSTKATLLRAVVQDVVLLTLFGLQHSIMSRPAFQKLVKSWCSAPIERLLHLVASTAAARLIMAHWRDLPHILYTARPGSLLYNALTGLSMLSFGFLLLSLLTAARYDLMRYYTALSGKQQPSIPQILPWVYRCTRQPLFSAMLAVFWCSPTMSYGRFLFSACMSVYTIIGCQMQERDQIKQTGAPYLEYMRHTPQLIPGFLWLEKIRRRFSKHKSVAPHRITAT